jgi:hypothetical protein
MYNNKMYNKKNVVVLESGRLHHNKGKETLMIC